MAYNDHHLKGNVMFKKPIPVTVSHELNLDELKATISDGADALKDTVRTLVITLAIGIPVVILFGVAANVVGDVVSDRLTNQ